MLNATYEASSRACTAQGQGRVRHSLHVVQGRMLHVTSWSGLLCNVQAGFGVCATCSIWDQGWHTLHRVHGASLGYVLYAVPMMDQPHEVVPAHRTSLQAQFSPQPDPMPLIQPAGLDQINTTVLEAHLCASVSHDIRNKVYATVSSIN